MGGDLSVAVDGLPGSDREAVAVAGGVAEPVWQAAAGANLAGAAKQNTMDIRSIPATTGESAFTSAKAIEEQGTQPACHRPHKNPSTILEPELRGGQRSRCKARRSRSAP